MNRTQGILSKAAAGAAACCAAAILAGCPAKAQNCPTFAVSGDPLQHIKIFNDSAQYLFPVLDTGQNPNPLGDIWMQAIFSMRNSQTPFGGGNCSYGENLDFRIYINELSGIAPIYLSAHPNAGLPNPLLPTGFPETPETFAPQLREWADDGEKVGRLVAGHPSSDCPPFIVQEEATQWHRTTSMTATLNGIR